MFQPILHNALYTAHKDAPDRRVDRYLWPSDLGKNPYHVARRLIDRSVEPFDYSIVQAMENGTALEAHNIPRAQAQLGAPSQTQVPLYNDHWSGYADLFINGKIAPIIYDHKATGGRYWDYSASLPRAGDCCQVLLYGSLMNEISGIGLPVETRLYYHGWRGWAEFSVSFGMIEGQEGVSEPGILARGWITNEKGEELEEVTRTRRVNPWTLRWELENIRDLILIHGASLADLEAAGIITDPKGPDWDYPYTSYDRLQEKYDYGSDGYDLLALLRLYESPGQNKGGGQWIAP